MSHTHDCNSRFKACSIFYIYPKPIQCTSHKDVSISDHSLINLRNGRFKARAPMVFFTLSLAFWNMELDNKSCLQNDIIYRTNSPWSIQKLYRCWWPIIFGCDIMEATIMCPNIPLHLTAKLCRRFESVWAWSGLTIELSDHHIEYIDHVWCIYRCWWYITFGCDIIEATIIWPILPLPRTAMLCRRLRPDEIGVDRVADIFWPYIFTSGLEICILPLGASLEGVDMTELFDVDEVLFTVIESTAVLVPLLFWAQGKYECARIGAKPKPQYECARRWNTGCRL